MAQFKLAKGILSENEAFRLAGTSLNDGYTASSTEGVGSLAAAREFVEEQKRIKALIALYITLIEKDAADIKAMAEHVEAMDSSVASSVGG